MRYTSPRSAAAVLWSISALGLAAGAVAPSARAENAPSRETARQTETAQVLAATFLGGEAVEWLCGGGFAPDGKVVLAGVTLGPEVNLAGVKAEVFGEDAPPAPPAATPPGERLAWNRPDATAFVAVLSPNLDQVLSVRRFPRGAGSATSLAVAKDGTIYLAGGAAERTERLAADSKTLTVAEHVHKESDCEAVYLAKLDPSATRILWVRRINGKSVAPRVRLPANGAISLLGPDIRSFDADGNLKQASNIPNGPNGATAVNPMDGTIARVGEWMTKTGREPWRCPHLHTFLPSGEARYQLYSWPPPLAGLNAFRLVADTTFRKAAYDDQGNLVITGWSHGGNTVGNRLAHDLERYWPYDGLGGYVANSCNYIIKHEPSDFQVVAATSWRGGKTWTIACAADGSVIWNGSPNRVLRTHPDLTACESTEDTVVVADPTIRKYLFFCSMPACARNVTVGACGKIPDAWAFGSGVVAGKTRVLLLTGATKSQRLGETEFPPPLRKALQPNFGGGALDGYVLLMELPPTSQPALPQAAAGTEAAAAPVDESKLEVRKPKNPPQAPAEGQRFEVTKSNFKTVLIAFRDPTGKMWPSFFYGSPETPTFFRYNTKERQEPKTALICDDAANARGLQDRRILGESIKDEKLTGKVQFTVNEMSPWRWEETATIRGNVKFVGYRAACEVQGELAVGERKLAVKALCVLVLPPNREFPNMSDVTATFTIKGPDLSLKAPGAQGDIQVKVKWTGWLEGQGKPGQRG